MSEGLRSQRRLAIGILSILVLVLTGCVGGDRGQSMEQATETIAQVEGLSGEATSGGYYSGWVYGRRSKAEVTLESGFEIADHRALALWLVQTAWSLNDDRPNKGVSVAITFPDRREFERWTAAEDSLDLPAQFTVRDEDAGDAFWITISVPDRFTREAGLGPWPAEVPTLPDNMIVKVDNG